MPSEIAVVPSVELLSRHAVREAAEPGLRPPRAARVLVLVEILTVEVWLVVRSVSVDP